MRHLRIISSVLLCCLLYGFGISQNGTTTVVIYSEEDINYHKSFSNFSSNSFCSNPHIHFGKCYHKLESTARKIGNYRARQRRIERCRSYRRRINSTRGCRSLRTRYGSCVCGGTGLQINPRIRIRIRLGF